MPPLDGETRIPNWFIALLSGLTSIVAVGAAVWAYQVQSDLAAIKTEIMGSYRLIDSKFGDVDRRLNSHDRRLERLEGQ